MNKCCKKKWGDEVMRCLICGKQFKKTNDKL